MLFKQKKKGDQTGTVIGQKISKIVQRAWDVAQKRFVTYLSGKTNGKTSLILKRYLILFCIACSAVSVWILIYPFISAGNQSISPLQKIKFPIQVYSSGKQPATGDSVITFNKFQKIMKFKESLDSMKSSSSGKKKYDSLMKIYPGLQDSIMLLKKLYYSQ